MKLMESAKSSSKSKNRNGPWPRFVICLENKGNEVSLEIGKVYRQLKPHAKDMAGWVRVVDESGEDYLFPGKRFAEIALPAQAKRALTKRRLQRPVEAA
jgi:hypothetical protein